MEKITQVEDNNEYPHPNPRDQQFVLLLRVTQDIGWPLPMEGCMGRAMVQMICDVTGVVPKEVEILMNQEVVVEVEDQSSIVEGSRGIQGSCCVRLLQYLIPFSLSSRVYMHLIFISHIANTFSAHP